ncbi:hypothetical protein QF001_000867 [Paraburkholderia youngii]|uniref:hypothetical protein n=1 Tax=Paraburkholderia youngii TaxID=2782701 RepID=UPI003D224618
MNAKQREKNRRTAVWLSDQQRCPECGERGRHYLVVPRSLPEILGGVPSGFWLCDKFYGEDGRLK